MSEPFTVNLGALAAYEDKLRDQAVTIAELKTRNENIHAAKELLVDDVCRLSAEVDRLRAERDEQVRVNGFLAGRGKEQDIIRDRLSDEVADWKQKAREANDEAFGARGNARAANAECASTMADLATARAELRRLEGERDGLREALDAGLAYDGPLAEIIRRSTSRYETTRRDNMRETLDAIRRALSTPTGTRAGAAENPKADAGPQCEHWRTPGASVLTRSTRSVDPRAAGASREEVMSECKGGYEGHCQGCFEADGLRTEVERLKSFELGWTASVSRLSAEVDRLRAERDEQVRVNGFLIGRGKEQDVIRDRLSAEVAGANATIVRREREHQDGLKRLGELFERYKVASHEAARRLEGEQDGLREALADATEHLATAMETFGEDLDEEEALDEQRFIDKLRALSTPTGTRAGAAENPKAKAVAVPPVTGEGE